MAVSLHAAVLQAEYAFALTEAEDANSLAVQVARIFTALIPNDVVLVSAQLSGANAGNRFLASLGFAPNTFTGPSIPIAEARVHCFKGQSAADLETIAADFIANNLDVTVEVFSFPWCGAGDGTQWMGMLVYREPAQ